MTYLLDNTVFEPCLQILYSAFLFSSMSRPQDNPEDNFVTQI